MRFKMDLPHDRVSRGQELMKRVRKNTKAKSELIVRTYSAGDTVHRALLTLASHNSWIHFSKVFFVKGKGGKRASQSFSAGCESAWADPKRRREPTTGRTNARHQRKDNRQEENKDWRMTRNPSRTRSPKQEQKMGPTIDWLSKNTDTVT